MSKVTRSWPSPCAASATAGGDAAGRAGQRGADREPRRFLHRGDAAMARG